MSRKILSLTLSISLLFQYSGFAQSINLANYLSQGSNTIALDRFRPLALRYFSYEPSGDNFKILLDKGDQKDLSDAKINAEADRLLTYFKIGLSLPNEKFWVNLRPDAADQIIDPELEKTDLGKVLLEADLQLKKDTSSLTSPQSKEGKVYWDKLYKKAGELFGTENITIPTITRPWIVPGEIIVRESQNSAYIYKAGLKVMLEEDYLNNQKTEKPNNQKTDDYNFSDPRLKELNRYSTELIKETILPELTKRINSSKDYASLRQVFFSLILARWFKDAFGSSGSTSAPGARAPENSYTNLIDSGDLTNLTSKNAWSKTAYFNEYKKSFQDGEYNLSEKVHTPTGQSIRRYTSGGGNLTFGINAQEVSIFKTVGSPAVKKDMFQITEKGDQKVGSPLVEDKELAKGLSGGLNNEGVNLFGLIEKAFEGKGSEFDRAGHQRVVKFTTDINIAGVVCKTLEILRYQQTIKGNDVKYRTIEFFADESSSEYVLQIKVYNDGRIETLSSKKLNDEERLLIAAVIRKIFKAESLIIMENLLQKAGVNYNLVEQAIQNRIMTEEVLSILKPDEGYIDFDLSSIINIDKTNLNTVAVNKLPDRVTINIYDRHNNVDSGNWISSRIYPGENISVILSNTLTRILPAMENANEIQIDVVDMVLRALGQEPSDDYLKFRIRFLDALNATKSSSAMEVSKKTEGSAIISAVKSLQDKLPDNGNEQLLKFIANVNPNGELKYPIKKDNPVMIGHVRGDRAWYLARRLQEMGFDKLLGYIKFDKDFKGVSVLPEEAVGKISNTFFEILSSLGYTTVRISEDEKKDHVGPNANGRDEQPFPGERRVIIKMQKSSMAYVDTPEMKMKEVADAVLAELTGNVDFILANFLSSDMMKHTGNFEAAKKSNEITDQQLGRIKERIDAIKEAVLEEMQDEVNYSIPESEERIHLLRLLTDNYDKFLRIVWQKYKEVWHTIKLLEKQVPLFVITADHGASETGLKENPKESDTFHSANPVPYVIYDPLRKQKIPLKEGKTIRNNAATLLQLLGEEVPKEYDESLLPADYQGSKRRIAFAVLDGWGINPDQSYPYDAIRLADTPNYDWFVKNASFTQLAAHGEVIGLRKILSYEEGPHHLRGLQAGQTDVGHIHLFSGREVKQPLWYMDQLIQGGLSNGVFDETKEEVKLLIRELNEVKEKGLKFHYIAVGSEGGVHVSTYHMYALMRLAKKVGLEKDQFVIHFAADGRDVPTRTAHLYLEDVYKRTEEIGIGVVSVVFGRDMLVRKEGAENITNRLIEVLSGENLKSEDVTLVKKTSESEDNSNAIIRNLQKVYNRIAPEYSDIWGDDVQEEVKRHREAFLEIIPKNAAVVDVGTGPGRDTAWFNDHGLQAAGIDFSKEMITQAQKRHPELKFQQMDMRRLEFESSSVDGIWNNGAFHHLPPDAARQAFKEFYRVMKSDGVLFLRVKQGDGEEFQPDKKYPNETRYFKFYQKDEIENLAAFQGFEIIKSGTEIDSKKPEQTWVYLFAKKVSSTGSPLLEEKKDEFKNLLAGILGAIKEIKPSKEIDKDLTLLDLDLKNADEIRREIGSILEKMDSVSDLNGLREKVNAAIVNLLSYADSGRIDKEIGKLKELYASLNADILADGGERILNERADEVFSMGKFVVIGSSGNEKDNEKLSEFVQRLERANVALSERHPELEVTTPLNLVWVKDRMAANEIASADTIITDPETANKIGKSFIPILSSGDIVILQRKKGVSSSLTLTEKPEIVGGIDLTQMNMLIQPQGGFASSSLDFSLPELSKVEIEAFNLDKELELIQRMASSGIDPIDERLKRYLAVCFARGRVGKEIDELKLCLEDVFIAQQLDARETPDGYKEVIVIADTRRFVLKESRLVSGKSKAINLN